MFSFFDNILPLAMCKSGLLGSNVSAISRVFSASGNLSRIVSICAFLIKKFAENGYCVMPFPYFP